MNNYSLSYTERFPEYSTINSLIIDKGYIYLDRTTGKGMGFQNLLKSTSSIEKYGLLTGQLLDSNNYSVEKEFSFPGGSFILSEKNYHYLVYWKFGFEYDANGDTIYYRENELVSFNDDLKIFNKTSLTFGPSYSNDTNSSYNFTSVLSVDIDSLYVYYRINITQADSNTDIYYLNKVGLDHLLHQEELETNITDFKIYPNPTSETIKILNFNKNSDSHSQYRIYGMNGKCLANGKITSKINVDYLSAGTYIIQFYSENNHLFFSKVFIHH